MIALPTNEYLQRFGGGREDLAAIVVEARKNGARLPWSYWHDRPLTVDEYLGAPTLFDPICRFDCDIPVDGVAAFVLTTSEQARDLPNRPVYVAGYGQRPAHSPPRAAALAARRHRRGRRGHGGPSLGTCGRRSERGRPPAGL
jgi:acetyl-CoA acetyltransferase